MSAKWDCKCGAMVRGSFCPHCYPSHDAPPTRAEFDALRRDLAITAQAILGLRTPDMPYSVVALQADLYRIASDYETA